MEPIGVYIHIPFCQVRCSYCDFNTYAGLGGLIDDYMAALCNEIETQGNAAYRASTIYFGGGTPSLLSATHLHRVLAACRASFDVSADAEITIEANPGTVTADSLLAMRKLGINRLSLGVQSLDDAMLGLLDRLHNAQQARAALALARQVGFDNVSLDFIYGLPGQTLDHWRRTLDQAIALQPEHLSLYALTLEEHTPMFQRVASGDIRLPDDDAVADMYTLAEDALDAAGYVHYEISNWSSSAATLSRHNSLYWRRQPYCGFGAGAHSFMGDQRHANVLHPREYIERMRTTGTALGESETITPQMARAETMFLGLRLLIEGVEVGKPSEGSEPSEGFRRQISDLVQAGLLEVDGQRVRLTRRGRLLSNQVFVRFMP